MAAQDKGQLARLVILQAKAETGLLVCTVFVAAVEQAMALAHPVAGMALMRSMGHVLQAQERKQTQDLGAEVEALPVAV